MNIKDIAKLAGVSTATVSRAVNGGSVKKSTKQRVDAVIEKYNYTPNIIAKQMHQKHVNRILVALPDITNPYYSLILKGIFDVCREADINVIVQETMWELEVDGQYFKMIDNQTVDGLIMITRIKDAGMLERLQRKVNHPMLQCSEFNEDLSIPHVAIDNVKAVYDAFEFLVSKGCKKIYFISANLDYTFAKKRVEGFLKAANDHQDIESLMLHTELTFDGGYDIAADIELCEYGKVGVIAVSDIVAIGVLNRALDRGVTVPDQLCLVGIDNIELSRYMRPSLTTIAQPVYELGEVSAKKMIEMIAEKHVNSVLLPHKLIERKTT